MEDELIIEKITSMLLGKGYVRAGFDGFRAEHFDYVEQHIDEILKDYNKSNVGSDTSDIGVKVTLRRIEYAISVDTESPEIKMKYDPVIRDYVPTYPKPQFQEYDILVNIDIISIESVEAMFGLDEDNDKI